MLNKMKQIIEALERAKQIMDAAENAAPDMASGDLSMAKSFVDQAIETAKDFGANTMIHVATIDYRHGTNSYVAFSQADLDRQIASYCSEYLEEAGISEAMAAEMSDRELRESYFEQHGTETLFMDNFPITDAETVIIEEEPTAAPKP